MHRILLVTKAFATSLPGGRELLCELNRDCLQEIYGDHLSVLKLTERRVNSMSLLLASMLGYIDGLNGHIIRETCDRIRREGITKVFVDGSNLGRMVAGIKRALPDVQVYTFLHNIEVRFFWGSLKRKFTPRAIGVMVANYIAERMAVRASDTLICLSRRDSDLMKRLYGRSANAILPIALRDRFPGDVAAALPRREKFLLFVGGAFYANVAGIEWFATKVAPHLRLKTYVVGRGLELFRSNIQRDGRVEVVGAVDSLAEWYRDSHLVIAPIFDGSGMKTKVAEALMFGKKIVGTPEAFSGYEAIASEAGWICRNANGFIEVINRLHDAPLPTFDERLRSIYQREYSYEAALSRLSIILGETLPGSKRQ